MSELGPDVAPLVRALLYPALFERDLLGFVDRVIEVTIDRQALGRSADDYAKAIDIALASDAELRQYGADHHAEEQVRDFLAEVRRRLAARG